jgi:hypothetical protein
LVSNRSEEGKAFGGGNGVGEAHARKVNLTYVWVYAFWERVDVRRKLYRSRYT